MTRIHIPLTNIAIASYWMLCIVAGWVIGWTLGTIA